MTTNTYKKQRKIIHVDMDAFFASIEQRDHPKYRHKPIAVGGDGRRSVVAAASYEARKFGVHSAMPSVIARQKCPEILFVVPRFDVYKAVSAQIMQIFREYTDLVEPLSLDEAYLDVTENKKGIRSVTEIAGEIKARIRQTTQLTASAGISVNKFVAKVASGMNKPDGLTVIPPGEVASFVQALSIEKFYGVGQVTAAKMKSLGIRTGKDLLSFSKGDLERYFGKTGLYFYSIARGIDERPVEPEQPRKSLGVERTFHEDIVSPEEQVRQLQKLADQLGNLLQERGVRGRRITLKIKYHDFDLRTRCRSVSDFIDDAADILAIAKQLLQKPDLPEKPVRLLGISVSNLNTVNVAESTNQLTLEF
ncbi:MAG: DNA polymerase IV [Fidelibacterota bacterium]